MRFIATTVLLLIVSTRVMAVPVEWTLTDIEFLNPGGSLTEVTGSFIYDADTLAISNSSLSGFVANPFAYGLDVSGNGSMIVFTTSVVPTVAGLNTYSGEAMVLGFTSALTNAGGETFLVEGSAPAPTISLLDNPSQIAFCSGGLDVCLTYYGIYSSDAGHSLPGSVIGSVVPLPPAAWLFGSALMGLGWLKRKQAA